MKRKLKQKIISLLIVCLTLMPLNTIAADNTSNEELAAQPTSEASAVNPVQTGTTYYISDNVTLDQSCRNGGKSKDKPISLLYFNSSVKLNPGDTVKFKNGSKFNEDISYNAFTENPNEIQRVTFTNYKGSDNSDELPQFSLYKITNCHSSWTVDPKNPNLWSIDFSDPASKYEGYRGCLDYCPQSLDTNAKKAYNNIGYIYNPANGEIYANGKSQIKDLKKDYDYCSYYDPATNTSRFYIYCHENPNKTNKELYFTDCHTIFNLRSNTNAALMNRSISCLLAAPSHTAMAQELINQQSMNLMVYSLLDGFAKSSQIVP